MADRCPTCAEPVWSKYHRCKPVYLVAIVSGAEVPDEGDYSEHRGHDAEEAATETAEEYDSDGEYDIVRTGDGGDYIAWVTDAAGTFLTKFSVYGESVPQYHAREYQPK